MDTELRDQSIDRSALNTAFATIVPQSRCRNVVLAIRCQQWKRRKSIDDLFSRLRTRESLEKFLQHETGRDYAFSALQSTPKPRNLRHVNWLIASQEQRPNTRIDEQAQPRDLSFL